MPLKRVWIPSPNYSSRQGQGVRLIVLHTAEGARTIESLGSYFQGDVGASSHVGIDDKHDTIGEYVNRANKSWTQAEFNPVSVSAELCGFASWSRDVWTIEHPYMLENCAKWIQEESEYWNIPITKLSASAAQGGGRGVCQHVDLGSRGGGHHDCGSGFPIDYVLDLARGTGSITSEEKTDMIASAVSDGGVLHVWWVDPDKRSVKYKYQRKGETNWHNGGLFTKASKDIAGISATLSAGGMLEVFAVYSDGTPVHTWQKPYSTNWSGGQAGKMIAEFSALP